MTWTPLPSRALRYDARVATRVLPSPVFISATLPRCSAAPPMICTSKWRLPSGRLLASRTAAKASGRRSSRVSPSARRLRKIAVSPRSSSSVSFSKSSSIAFTCSEMPCSFLRLRPWRDTDAPGPGEGPDADSLRFMPAGAQPGPDDFPTWLERRRQDMDAGGDLHWCIADLSTDEMLGNIQIFRMGPVEGRFQGELGYWLRPGARGRGVVGEAIEAVAANAFRAVVDGGLGFTRLHAATDSDNYASHSILRSAGFTQWGADHKAWRRADGSLSV